jgi:hypothetical protein
MTLGHVSRPGKEALPMAKSTRAQRMMEAQNRNYEAALYRLTLQHSYAVLPIVKVLTRMLAENEVAHQDSIHELTKKCGIERKRIQFLR